MRTVFKPKNFETKKFDYLFVGWIRPEKGVDILLDAWMKYKQKINNKKLIIAGKISSFNQLKYNLSELESNNIIFKNEYIDDQYMAELMSLSKYLVLPYKQGTNSGFPLIAIQNGCIPLVSNIDMFTEMNYLSKRCYFEVNNIESLVEKFNQLEQKEIKIDKLQIKGRKYKDLFIISVNDMYRKMLKNE